MTALDPIVWAIILMVLGCGLVVMEVFIPSGGLLSFFSAVVIISSVIVAFRRDMTTGLSFVVVTLIAVPTVVALAFKFWPQTPMGRAFLGELPTEEETRLEDDRRALVGRVGVARSKMLPSGAVFVDGKLVDAVSQGGAIEHGQAVVVVEVRGNRVIVRAADEEEARQAVSDPHDALSKPLDEFGFEDPLT